MTQLSSYSTGTVSIASGGTTVTGVGSVWSGTNVKPGDIIQVGNFQSVITDVTDLTHLVIPPWGGGALSAVSYTIWQMSPQRFAGAQAMQTVNELVAAFNTSGFFVFVDIADTVPDPSLGDDGQYAMQPTTGKQWVKIAGVWTYQGIYKAFSLKGAWSGATAYMVGDVATLSGSSYVCVLGHTNHAPPNVTYWQLLASIGATGNTGATGAGYGGTSTTSLAIGTGAKAFTTQAGLAYTNGARVRASSAANTANWMEGRVTYSGTTLTMTSDKTGGSGTLADWNLNVVGEPGAGDLTSANNLSDVANPGTAANNLGVVRYGGSQSLSAGQKKQVYSNIGVREPLTGSRTYFVRTDGNDGNDGLTNSSGGAFLTPQRAFDVIAQTLDTAGQLVTVNLVSGVFPGFNVNGGWVGNGNIIVEMNSAATLRAPNTGVAVNTSVPLGGNLTVQNGTLDCATTSGALINHNGPGNLRFGNITMNGGNSIGFDMVSAYANCFLSFFGNITFGAASGWREIFYSHAAGYIDLYGGVSGLSMTMAGNMSWTDSFVYAEANSLVNAVAGARTISLGGFTMTGKRFTAAAGGAINTNGGGLTYFPGSIAGTPAAVSPSGVYS